MEINSTFQTKWLNLWENELVMGSRIIDILRRNKAFCSVWEGLTSDKHWLHRVSPSGSGSRTAKWAGFICPPSCRRVTSPTRCGRKNACAHAQGAKSPIDYTPQDAVRQWEGSDRSTSTKARRMARSLAKSATQLEGSRMLKRNTVA